MTFIVTCYNLPTQMLCECINSLLALSLSPQEREIIIVDDGSDVSPMNSLMQFGDDIMYIRQKNGGVSVARNTALSIAHGKYIQIVDGDDTLIQVPYEHCLDIIRYQQDTDLLMFDFSKSGNEPYKAFSDTAPTTGADYMRLYNIHGAAWSCLFRSSVRGNLQFTPGIRYGEDEEFMAQLLIRSEVVCATDAKAYYYRDRSTSAVRQQDSDSKRQRLDDTMEVLLHLNSLADRLPPAERTAMQRRVAQLTMDYIYNTIVLTRSRQALDERIATLHQKGLFPLPDRKYTAKYQWFRRMTNSSIGLSMLLHTLPYLKRER